QFDKLKADPSLVKSAVEELLRHDSPVQLTSRTVMEEVEVGGQQFRRGQQGTTMPWAAQPHPARLTDPAPPGSPPQHYAQLSLRGGTIPPARRARWLRVGWLLASVPPGRSSPSGVGGVLPPPYRDTWVLRGLQSLPVTL